MRGNALRAVAVIGKLGESKEWGGGESITLALVLDGCGEGVYVIRRKQEGSAATQKSLDLLHGTV